MPEMDGVEAVAEIRKFDSKVKIIMCSAMGQQSMILSAIRAGASNFIVKPFTDETICQIINTTMGIKN